MADFVRFDIVTAKSPGKPLRSGAQVYDYAVVASVSPFVLSSPSGDMLWRTTMTEADVVKTGETANVTEVAAVLGRMSREQ